MAPPEVVLTENPSDDIVIFRLNRPEVRNALNLDLRKQLANGVAKAGTDPKIRCVIITGSDKIATPAQMTVTRQNGDVVISWTGSGTRGSYAPPARLAVRQRANRSHR